MQTQFTFPVAIYAPWIILACHTYLVAYFLMYSAKVIQIR